MAQRSGQPEEFEVTVIEELDDDEIERELHRSNRQSGQTYKPQRSPKDIRFECEAEGCGISYQAYEKHGPSVDRFKREKLIDRRRCPACFELWRLKAELKRADEVFTTYSLLRGPSQNLTQQ